MDDQLDRIQTSLRIIFLINLVISFAYAVCVYFLWKGQIPLPPELAPFRSTVAIALAIGMAYCLIMSVVTFLISCAHLAKGRKLRKKQDHKEEWQAVRAGLLPFGGSWIVAWKEASDGAASAAPQKWLLVALSSERGLGGAARAHLAPKEAKKVTVIVDQDRRKPLIVLADKAAFLVTTAVSHQFVSSVIPQTGD